MSSAYISSSDWRRIADGLGQNKPSARSKMHRETWSISLAENLLEQINSDFDPQHFTLAELQAEYAVVSSAEAGTPVYYGECLQILERAGRIAKNEDGSYRICE